MSGWLKRMSGWLGRISGWLLDLLGSDWLGGYQVGWGDVGLVGKYVGLFG